MNVAMPIAAVMLDLGFPSATVKAVPILARTAGLLAHLAEEQRAAARLPHGGERGGGDRVRAPPEDGRADARAGGRDPPVGGAARRSTTRATAPSSPTSSSARPSIARSWRRRGSPPPRRRAGSRRSRSCPSPRSARSGTTCTPDNPIGAHLCATPSEIVRIYSTSGTTGTPSYIPLTAGDLDNWVTGSARSYAASGVAAGQRIVTTYNAGPFVAGAALASFDRIGLCHIPVGTGNTERLMRAIELLRPEAAVLTPSYAAHLVEWAAERDLDLAGVERRARARGGRARRRRAGLPREARGGLGRAGHRGDGHRRHRRLALGRVRGAGRDAPGRARLRPRRADRPRDGRARSSWTTAPPASSC